MVYDRDGKSLTELYVGRPALAGERCRRSVPWRSRPATASSLSPISRCRSDSDKDGDCKPDKPLPMVLNVHGGPWYRDSYRV